MGLLTWGYARALPGLIQRHNLPFDQARFDRAVLVAQEEATHTIDPAPIIARFMAALEWPSFVSGLLMAEMRDNFQPELFEDAFSFLEALKARGDRVYVVSNNPRTPGAAEALGLTGLICGVFTPATCPDTTPKPHPSLWEHITSLEPAATLLNTVVVGDDPWSDGLFAENCGLPCWIVDRYNRLETVVSAQGHRRARTLLDIPLSGR